MSRSSRTSPVYRTPEWKRARKRAIERASGRCEVCGVQPSRLHVHHVRGVVNDPTHEELQVLDPTCHDILELISRRKKNRLSQRQVIKLWHLAQRKL